MPVRTGSVLVSRHRLCDGGAHATTTINQCPAEAAKRPLHEGLGVRYANPGNMAGIL